MATTQPTDTLDERLHVPAPGEAQLTVRAVLAGCVIGGIGAVMNVYLGLKTLFAVGGSLMTAILAFGFFALLGRRLSVLETNISQTAGMAASGMASAAGLLAPVPAMLMMGHDVPALALLPWGLAVAYLGVFFAVPLRAQYVLLDRLPFPSGTATAHTIVTMFARVGDALARGRVMIQAGAVAASFSLLVYFVPQVEVPPIEALWAGPMLDVRIGALELQGGLLAILAAWGFSIAISPLLIGSGFLIGGRVALSLLGGAVLAWGVLGPLVTARGWVQGPPLDSSTGAYAWLMWPGAALMIGDALFSLVLSYKTIVRTFWPARTASAKADGDLARADGETIPRSWWTLGLLGCSVVTCALAWALFDIPVWMTALAIPLSAVLAAVATRAAGETDLNPTGPMGQVTQVVYGAIAPGSVPTNLMTGAITIGGAGQCADMMQDLKTGHLLGASPRKQLIAQLCGITAGVLIAVPTFFLFARVYDIGGSQELPAPSAMLWRAVAELMNHGWDSLPTHAATAMAVALGVGAALATVRALAPRAASFLPSGLAVGLAFLLPASNSICIFAGAMILLVWQRARPDAVAHYAYAVACGLIAGDGLMGVVKVLLTMAGVPTLTG
ncbi:MAG TPA: OPT family oligopeptide transporter [Haliangium sp.]|nr:OPT family oligopeptide transporter [Haliangium sp.]